jgi:general stress protein 26
MTGRREVLRTVLLAGATLLLAPLRALAQRLPVATKEALETSKLIYVATQRKSGQRSTIAPVWFVWENDTIWTTTSPDSWKAKRIARGSPLFINVGSKDGPKLRGKATKVTDPALIDRMGQAYSDKYWIAWMGLFRPRSERVTSGKTVAYLVDVTEE